jgi:competence protein ComEC
MATAGCTLLAPRHGVEIATGSVVAALLGRRLTGTPRLVVLGFAVGVSLGAITSAWHVHGLRAGPVPALAVGRVDVVANAKLVRDPVAVTTASGVSLTLTDATVTRVTSLDVPVWRSANSPVLVLSYGRGWLGLLPGQRVEFSGRLSPPRRGDDVSAVIDARGPPVAIGRPPWWQRLAGRVRLALRHACDGLPADERGLLPGLVDGDVSAVPPSMHVDLRLTGLTHLEAVSGENVSVMLAVTLAVARTIGLRRRWRIGLSALALLGFVVVARPSPSVLRAAVMGGLVLLAMMAGRRISPLPALSAAVLVLVCVDPFLARSIGFVLSVCATAALLTLAPVWTERLSRHLPRPIAATIAIPAAAQLACTPVLLLAFGQLTPYAVPANLLAAPAVAPATVLGVVCASLAALWAPLGIPVAWAGAVPTALIAVVARSVANLPGAGLRWPGGWRSEAAVLVIIGLAWLVRRRRRPRSRDRESLTSWPP